MSPISVPEVPDSSGPAQVPGGAAAIDISRIHGPQIDPGEQARMIAVQPLNVAPQADGNHGGMPQAQGPRLQSSLDRIASDKPLRPGPLTPAQLLGLAPPDPGRTAMQAMLPRLRQIFPIGQEVFRSRAIYGNTFIHRADRGDDVFRLVAAISGVQALEACMQHGPDLMSLAGWTPRQILNWSIQPNGINFLEVSAAEARRNPSRPPPPLAETRGLAGLPELYDSMARSGTRAQRGKAEAYRGELETLRRRFERIQYPGGAQPAAGAQAGALEERENFRETIAELFERAESDYSATPTRLAGQDFRAVAGHVMVWLFATER